METPGTNKKRALVFHGHWGLVWANCNTVTSRGKKVISTDFTHERFFHRDPCLVLGLMNENLPRFRSVEQIEPLDVWPGLDTARLGWNCCPGWATSNGSPLTRLGRPIVPFDLFWGEGSPTKLDYRKRAPLFPPLYWRT